MDLSGLLIFSPIPVYLNGKLEAFDCSCHGSLDTDCAACQKQQAEYSENLIHAVPWYKTVSNLHLWDVSFIDAVIISSPMGMLGLPFLTRNKSFSAKVNTKIPLFFISKFFHFRCGIECVHLFCDDQVYATEATARIGKLIMDDLVYMHRELRQFYGPVDAGSAQWMNWDELEKIPPSVQEMILGKDGTDLGGWLALYR